MDTVKDFLRAGASFSGAVRLALGRRGVPSFVALCAEWGLTAPEFSRMVSGRAVPSEPQLDALIDVLGGTRQEWLDLWFAEARKAARATLKIAAQAARVA